MAYKQVALNFMNKAAVEIKQGLGETRQILQFHVMAPGKSEDSLL